MTYGVISKSYNRQRGMASIVITLVTMLVIALIVLGFAAISRREQRQSLDQQLSAQAFYAAESGIEDAKTAIQSSIGSGKDPVGKSKCNGNDPGGNYPIQNQTLLDADSDVRYSCLKVDLAPKSVVYDGVGEDSIVVPIKSAQAFDRIELTWKPTSQPQGTPASCPGSTANVFTPQPDWACGYGLLRTEIVPTDGVMDVNTLYNTSMNGWFVPTRNPTATGQSSYATVISRPNGDRNDIVAAACDTAAYTQCKANITNLAGHRQMYLRVSSLYRQSNVSVIAYQGAKPVAFSGVQVVIDSTGRAQDVLRRIQVRVPLNPAPATPPNYALQTNSSICKRFEAGPGLLNIPGDIVDPDPGNPMCVQKNDVPPSECTPNHDVVLVLDHSGSMTDKLQGSNVSTITQLRKIVTRFITNTNITPATNHVGIIEFDDEAKLGIGLTSDQQALLNYTATVNADGGTVYIKGLDLAQRELTGPRARAGSPKTVIFISDGAPNDPTGPIRTKTQAMKDAGIAIYTIGLNNAPDIQLPGWLGGFGGLGFDEQLLKDMAGAGGRYFLANTDADAQAGLDGISIDLKCEAPTPPPPPPPPAPACTPANDVALVLDHSGSMDNKLQGSSITTIAQLKNIVRNFINNTNIAPDTNHVAIVKFNSSAVLGVGLTSDQQALLNYINGSTLGHGTNYIPALNIATGELNGTRGRPSIPKVVIFISDGNPDDNATQIRSLTTNMKGAGIRIYTIGLDNDSGGIDEPLLIDMAGNGGRYFRANTDAEAQAGLDGISLDLKCTSSLNGVKRSILPPIPPAAPNQKRIVVPD